ncbi:MAG: dioxygenase [Rhodospirillaceae bacterium]|nr:MAG: dioxygenase [Rhodospirillaceae bacterium]
MKTMPTVFIPHGGGPCFFMDWNPPDTWDKQAAHLRGLPNAIGERPKAILVLSGHWEEAIATVQTNPAPSLLFDYGGFPAHTYELTYPALGNPDIAMRVVELLETANIPTNMDPMRGYDHGVFIPLKVAYPKADIPVIQLSLCSDLDPDFHIAMGKALRPLRDEGVLIMGSGNTYHNMSVLMRAMHNNDRGKVAGQEFDAWLSDAVCNTDPEVRNRMLSKWAGAPGALSAHPREEHLIPLLVVAGAAGTDIGHKTLEDHVMGAVESAFQFG